MAIMKVARTMRDGRAGNSINVIAKAGARIDILDDSKLPWTQIRLQEPPQPIGWVSDEAIDKTSNTLGPLDKQQVASACVEQGAMSGANAFYLMAVAQLRTNVIDVPAGDDGGVGLYRFTAKEWTLNRSHPEIGIDVPEADLSQWRAQCVVFAAMASATQADLEKALDRQVSMVELLLAQLLGAGTMLSAIGTPTSPMADCIAKAGIAQPVPGAGIDPANLAGRDAALLAGETIADALKSIENALVPAFAASRNLVQPEVEKYNALAQQLGAMAPVAVGAINYDAAVVPRAGRQWAQLIAQKFAAAGYGTIAQIAAIANAIAESGLKPNAENRSGESSFGLFQLNQNGGVGFGYEEPELKDPARNIEIMLAEIAKPYQKKNQLAYSTTTSLHEAVKIFVYGFEQPAAKASETEKRYAIAQKLVV